MPGTALFLNQQSFTHNSLSGFFLGMPCQWTTRKDFMKLCRTSILLARDWLKCHVFSRRGVYVDGVYKDRIGHGARWYLNEFYKNPHVDMRLIEQQLRHSVEWWYPRVLLWCVLEATTVPSCLGKLVIRYAQIN